MGRSTPLSSVDVEQLLEGAWPDAYRIAFGITRDRGLAEDAAQEACAQAFRSFVQLRDLAAFRPWLYRMVVRSATSIARKAGRELASVADASIVDPPGVDAVAVTSALDSLTRAQRAVVILHYYAQMNSREIAEVLGISDGAVRLRLLLAKRRLRRLLATDERPHVEEIAHHV